MVQLAADWLTRRGHAVTLPAVRVTPDPSKQEEYADEGDLYIQQRIEVKHLSAQFTGRQDWPFKDFIVCAKHSFDNAFPKPHAYIILSKDLCHVAVVMAANHKSWTVSERTDKRYDNIKQDFYFSPLDQVLWGHL